MENIENSKPIRHQIILLGMFAWLMLVLSFQQGHAAGHVAAGVLDSEASEAKFTLIERLHSSVDGVFEEFSAEASFDENVLTKFMAVAKVTSINTEKKKRDKHLRGKDFFEVKVYPNITLRMLSIDNEKSIMKAMLTIRHTTKEIPIDFMLSKTTVDGKDKLRLTLNFSLDRRDYGVGRSFAAKIISHEIDVALTLVFDMKAS